MTPKPRSWRVLRDRFPVAAPGPELGIIVAPTRVDAHAKALTLWRAPLVVEAVVVMKRRANAPHDKEKDR